MPKKSSPVSINERRANERRVKARIMQLLRSQGVLRGNISERLRACGSAGCKCASGEKHAGTYLVQSREGKTRQLYVPAGWADDVKQWVTNYQVMQQLLDELSDIWWENIETREL
jgi:hypothetical protein